MTDLFEKLQKKEVRVSGKQFDILNEETRLYVARKDNELIEFRNKQRETQALIDEVNRLTNERAAKLQEQQDLQYDLANSQERSIVGMLERRALRSELKDVKKELERLNKKLIRCDRRAQVNKVVNLEKEAEMRMAA